MATVGSGQQGQWRTRLRHAFLVCAASLVVMGCQQPVPPAPSPTSASSAAVVKPSPSAAAAVASSSPVAAQAASPSPSPSPLPVVVVTAVPQVWPVVSWEATRRYQNEMFTFRGILNSDGSGGMREPAGNMGFPPNREKAEKVMALADRLAPYTVTPASPADCKLEFRGRGQEQATDADKRAVAQLAGC